MVFTRNVEKCIFKPVNAKRDNNANKYPSNIDFWASRYEDVCFSRKMSNDVKDVEKSSLYSIFPQNIPRRKVGIALIQ